MKKLNVYYALVDNMGDRLNPYIMRRLFGFEIRRVTPLTCELSGIGSGLGQFTFSDKPWLASGEWFTGKMFPETCVWGTGFIRSGHERPFYRPKMHFNAVRGELSKKKAEKLLGTRLDSVLGDGGILAEQALGERPPKKYSVGVAAHYKEQNHPAFKHILDTTPGALWIDMCGETETVIRDIASCEVVISSSLHALIVADSFHIPNIHIHVSDAMLGDGFKFKDYYSAYGLDHIPHEYDGEHTITVSEIIDNYRVPFNKVEMMKENMLRSFPF